MLEGIPGPLVSSAKGTKGLAMTLTSWYVSYIHGSLVSWFPLSLKGSQRLTGIRDGKDLLH